MSFRNRIKPPQAQPSLTRMSVPTQSGRSNILPGVDNIALANRIKPRRAELLQVLTQVDASVDQVAQTQIMEWIREEYEARQGGEVIGMFAKCYLGPPFVDHKLDLFGSILQHFSPAQDPGYPYSQARGLVRSGSYAFIEIYSDGKIVPILPDGTAVSM
ncbi:hypothetical protein L2K20_20420 [Mycobacterium sp. MBM]|nr:hypothetical protein [Mycobacterium sp. MBM]